MSKEFVQKPSKSLNGLRDLVISIRDFINTEVLLDESEDSSSLEALFAEGLAGDIGMGEGEGHSPSISQTLLPACQ